jgi:hypothetical protein
MSVLDVPPIVSLSGPSSGTAGTPVGFTASATDVSPAVQAAGFTYNWNFGDGTTGTGNAPSHTFTAAGTYTVSVTATDVDGATSQPANLQLPISNPGGGHTYYVAPNATSGDGTITDPFGLPDLIGPNYTPGQALTILGPGDTLYFLGGTYQVAGNPNSNYWADQLLGPTVSGTPTQPITLEAYPGQTVDIVMTGGDQPVFGTSGPLLSYVRFLGFSVDPGPGIVDGGAPTAPPAFLISGTGNEVGYCEVVGRYIATADNHDGIRIESANAAWIHNDNVHGITGLGYNSAGLKVYKSTNILVEDNYVHDNYVGIFDKDGGSVNGSTQATYRRNFVRNDTTLSFYGNNQGALSVYYIYDNIFYDGIDLHVLNEYTQVYNNLLSGVAAPVAAESSVSNLSFWNNIILDGGGPINVYMDNYMTFTPSGPQAPLQCMDYNVYDGAPSYSFGAYTTQPTVYNLSQMQAQGFEQHSQVVGSDLSIFQDLTSYQLLPQWTNAGRYGDPVGPRYPIAQILDTSRYGPATLGTGSSPSITQQPQNQTVPVGGTATFSIQVNGSAVFYQWQRTDDGGSTWSNILGANAPVYAMAPVSSSDNRAIFRCLISSRSGSAWSWTATLSTSSV